MRRPLFPGSQPEVLQEGVGHQDQRDVVVPTRPRPALEVVEAEFVLQLLVTVLDEVPTLGECHQSKQRGVSGQVGEVELTGYPITPFYAAIRYRNGTWR